MKNKILLLSALSMGLIAIERTNADCPKGIDYYTFHTYFKKIGDQHKFDDTNETYELIKKHL